MYTPKYFSIEEIFPKNLVKQGNHKQLWRLMDDRILWTADQLRKLFGTIIINDYMWGGKNQYRGFRDFQALIDLDYLSEHLDIIPKWSSFTSQHCFGRALDCKFKNELVQDVRSFIIKNEDREEFKYITAIEKEVSWLHIDVRNYAGMHRFFIF